MSFAARLKQVRKSRGYTQEELSNITCIPCNIISNIESEKIKPQETIIKIICKILQINEHWLITGYGNMDTIPNSEDNSYLLSVLHNYSKNLSKHDQNFALDIIKDYKNYLNSLEPKNFDNKQ